MGIAVGIDIGAISTKIVAVGAPSDYKILESISSENPSTSIIKHPLHPFIILPYTRTRGSL